MSSAGGANAQPPPDGSGDAKAGRSAQTVEWKGGEANGVLRGWGCPGRSDRVRTTNGGRAAGMLSRASVLADYDTSRRVAGSPRLVS